MKHTNIIITALLAIGVSVNVSAETADAQSVGSILYAPQKIEAPVTWRTPDTIAKSSDLSSFTEIRFSELAPDEFDQLKKSNTPETNGMLAKPLRVGVNRFFSLEAKDKTQPQLQWQTVSEGSVARLFVTSPDAPTLRVGLKITALPDNAEFRFAGSNQLERIVGVVSGKEALDLRSDNDTYWTPMTSGETQIIEIFIPVGNKLENIDLSVDTVSHIFVSMLENFDASKIIYDYGDSGSCNINVVCKDSLGNAYKDAVKAVARMYFIEGSSPYTCTGTLLNNTNKNGTPYFWTAAHCISGSGVANTLETVWFEESSTCANRTTAPNRVALSGGADLLYANTAYDTTLLRLKRTPPGGAVFADWNNAAFSTGNIVAIHHPNWDIKKVSLGRGEGTTCAAVYGFGGSNVNASTLALVSWQEGTTEGGSSGSGLFPLSSSGTYQLRGGLAGGLASCANTGQAYQYGNVDCYSSLNRVWSSIKPYLSPETTSPPTGDLTPSYDYRGMWYKTGEGGWGLTIDQYVYTSGRKPYLFVAWYAYNNSGNALWYLFEGEYTKKNELSADVYLLNATPWGPTFDTNQVRKTKAGTATLTFTSATQATFQYNVNNVSRTVIVNKSQ
ncbi:MAG: hypothetical protein LBS40_04420 [Burkholderiales bacterium]|jgi:hypothetical protein|nr:hypothetical protein [Burkholderiales bacterium]